MWNKDYNFKSYLKVLGCLRQSSFMQFFGSDRPGRSEPRVLLRRPKIYPLMTKPRHELRKQL
ncbi:hypothetical protein [Nostoc sp.]|uniref:hypothetical protein n=1 Tax=Nostoc sp. TaxID=1180 RepID=UPI002FF74148